MQVNDALFIFVHSKDLRMKGVAVVYRTEVETQHRTGATTSFRSCPSETLQKYSSLNSL
jgi:hypothetical protein